MSKKKPIKEIQTSRSRKAKLERVSRDTTKRRKTEETLQRSKDLYQAVMENAYFAITLIDSKYKILMANSAASRMLRKPACELIGRECFREFEKRGSVCPHCPGKRAIATGQPAEVETEGVRDDGSRFSVRIQTLPTIGLDGNVTGFIELIEDITERKQAEQQLRDYQMQLKSLASELTLTEERERRRIAADLHDQISQSLVISKIKLDTLRSFVPSEDLVKELNEISDSLYQTIQDIRSLTFDLSFPILYELGFEAAVAAWLVEQIQEKYGITTEFEDDGQPKPLDDDVRVLLFRDVRELLVNVVRHANAKKVKVSIRKVGSEIHARVEDDGVGFDVAKVVSTSAVAGGFGFFSIRERLEELGGHLEIDSEPGHGTRVTLMVPLKQQNTKGRQK